jgi:hypothetical protein
MDILTIARAYGHEEPGQENGRKKSLNKESDESMALEADTKQLVVKTAE